MRAVLIPGFSQMAAMWDGVVADLPPAIDTTALDVPDDLDFHATAEAIGAAGGRGAYIGYSMGGRLALSLAVTRPDLVTRLVLVSAAPGIRDAAERDARATADAALATEVRRDGVDSFLPRWLAQPMFATLPPEHTQARLRRAGNSATRLAHQLTALGQGTMPSYWDALKTLAMPVLIVTGTLDAKYESIGVAMATGIPDVRHVRIEGGHALPLEQPTHLAAHLATFLGDAPGAA